MSRTGYYRPTTIRRQTDNVLVGQLTVAHQAHPLYGVRRLALHLGWSENRTRRIRTKASIKIARASRKKRSGRSANAEIAAPPNALKRFAQYRNEVRPQDGMSYSAMTDSGGWVQDFTYLWFQRVWYYLAVVLDLKTRQVIGWRLGLNHSSQLTHAALLDALSKYPSPSILHSDQGSEYLSLKHQIICQQHNITLSCSAAASPWQNGFMERFFGSFKSELGRLSSYQDLGQLHEAIALTMHYYNHERIHTALRMSPAAYAASLKSAPLTRDKLLQKMVA